MGGGCWWSHSVIDHRMPSSWVTISESWVAQGSLWVLLGFGPCRWIQLSMSLDLEGSDLSLVMDSVNRSTSLFCRQGFLWWFLWKSINKCTLIRKPRRSLSWILLQSLSHWPVGGFLVWFLRLLWCFHLLIGHNNCLYFHSFKDISHGYNLALRYKHLELLGLKICHWYCR